MSFFHGAFHEMCHEMGYAGSHAARCLQLRCHLGTPFNAPQVENPFLDLAFQPPTVERFALRKSFKGHLNSISAVAFHPRKVGTGCLCYVFPWP